MWGKIQPMSRLKSPLILFLATVGLIALIALFGPEDKSLGANVRIVYLHGAWVLTAEIAFILAGVAGFLALIRNRPQLDSWSAALGRTGTVFWVTYLPLSLLAMKTNWNGLFLAEPRFRLALTFAVVAVLMQVGLWLVAKPAYTSAANALFIMVLRFERHAPAALADFQFWQLCHYRFLYRAESALLARGVFPDKIVPVPFEKVVRLV
jgi:hypothetical protein